MNGCIAFDLTRLFLGPLTPTPRGIDRVDLAFARHFLQRWNGECVGVLPLPWGIRWFNRDRSLRLVAFIEGYWAETADPDRDIAYGWLKEALSGHEPSRPKPRARSGAAPLALGIARLIRQAGFSLGRPIATLPAGAVYLNTGQVGLAIPRLLTWLAWRTDVKPVFMLHDTIPIETPEYTAALSSRAHRQMLVSTARHAKGLIVTTDAARLSIRRELDRLQSAALPTLAAPLPVPAPFLQAAAEDPDLRRVGYFVVCGAIEPRKNHRLLLNVWRALIARHGKAAPKLVIAGSRWRTTDDVIDLLENCALLKGHVIEVAGLSTPALRQTLLGARGLLMPSFAEGFGLPIVEALAVGAPVIASDLPAHREAGGGFATYLPPRNEALWLAAVESLAAQRESGAARRHRSQYEPLTPAQYFARVEQFIAAL